MSAYIVTYDLHKQGQNYDCLVKKLKQYSGWFHMQGSVWVISTNSTSTQIRDDLKSCLDSNDKLFVGKLSGEAAWWGYTQVDTDWLKKHL
ncbi:CRISPR-associated protein Cas2 [Erythrobacter aureus]|uniref:CRISPR-associated protein Cas2 n=1 Tax=Erythrobacter aureus TaxID=2182384 RepID=UPI003A8CFBED